MPDTADLIENAAVIRSHAVEIVAAYVGGNHVAVGDLPGLIHAVHSTLLTLSTGGASSTEADPAIEKPTPAQIKKSIRPDGLISFIDGKSYKTLKRHLTKHGFDPQSYRERYGLPADYPTTSANYSAQRSELAKALGLGQPGRPTEEASEPASKQKSRKAA